MRVRNEKKAEKIELQMTAMIDIVFQLLTFFVMTFKVVTMEGDFNIKMPSGAPAQGAPDDEQLPPLRLRMRAAGDGSLAGMQINERAFGSFDELHQYVLAMGGNDLGPNAYEGAEVEIDADYGLAYDNVIKAISAVSGHRGEDDEVIKMIEKIKFSPPKSE